MHNRVRMIVASLLVKNLRLHWLEGARWFWDTLVDADLAANTLPASARCAGAVREQDCFDLLDFGSANFLLVSSWT